MIRDRRPPGSGSRARASRFARIISTRRFSISIIREWGERAGDARSAREQWHSRRVRDASEALCNLRLPPPTRTPSLARENESIHSFIEGFTWWVSFVPYRRRVTENFPLIKAKESPYYSTESCSRAYRSRTVSVGVLNGKRHNSSRNQTTERNVKNKLCYMYI